MTPEAYPVLLTGATGAIGREIARGLLRRGKPLILGCRDEKKGTSLADKLRSEFPDAWIRLLLLDLSSEHSVVEASSTLQGMQLEALINNAGVMNRRFRLSADGHEMTMAVNYYNTCILTELLKDRIRPGGAIVFTTSLTRFLPSEGDDQHKVTEETFSQLGTYGHSKRLLTNYALQLGKRLEKKRIRVNCADPGVVNTGMIRMQRWYDRLADLFFRPFIRSPRHGAIPALRAFEAPASGKIYCRFLKHRLKELGKANIALTDLKTK